MGCGGHGDQSATPSAIAIAYRIACDETAWPAAKACSEQRETGGLGCDLGGEVQRAQRVGRPGGCQTDHTEQNPANRSMHMVGISIIEVT
jgi:hypothetical protein